MYLYNEDRAPPHFHAVIAGQEVVVGIDPVIVLKGSLPQSEQAHVLDWARRRQADLLVQWRRARQGLPIERLER